MADSGKADENGPGAPGPAVRAGAGSARRGAGSPGGPLGARVSFGDRKAAFPGGALEAGPAIGTSARYRTGSGRASRDWAAECTDAPREVCELALAHVNTNATEAAYLRSDLFERRRELMEQWARFLTGPGSTEVPVPPGKRPTNRVGGRAAPRVRPPDSTLRFQGDQSSPSTHTMGALRETEAPGRAPPNSPSFAGVAVEVGPQSVLRCRKTYVRRFKHYLILQHRTGR